MTSAIRRSDNSVCCSFARFAADTSYVNSKGFGQTAACVRHNSSARRCIQNVVRIDTQYIKRSIYYEKEIYCGMMHNTVEITIILYGHYVDMGKRVLHNRSLLCKRDATR